MSDELFVPEEVAVSDRLVADVGTRLAV